VIRDAVANIEYFDKWVEFEKNLIAENIDIISRPSGNPGYRPQFVRDLAFMHLKLLLYRFSRGDPVEDLPQYFEPFLHYWEESMRLGATVWTAEQQTKRHSWAINLEHYMDSFWLVGLALAFNIPMAQWQRLLKLIGNEGEDTLLDKLIASREPGRKIGSVLCYPMPYKKLLTAIESPKSKQAQLLQNFVENWYVDLAKAVKKASQQQGYPITKPYWYNYHNPMHGAYFGYWCLEAIAAVKAFNLDDSLCTGHPHYPGDLLHPSQTTAADATRLPAALVASINAPVVPPVRPPETLSNWQAFKMVIKNKFNS
jgi:Domain of unknown function (DUF1911)/Domain of unknown function (DUF1910)